MHLVRSPSPFGSASFPPSDFDDVVVYDDDQEGEARSDLSSSQIAATLPDTGEEEEEGDDLALPLEKAPPASAPVVVVGGRGNAILGQAIYEAQLNQPPSVVQPLQTSTLPVPSLLRGRPSAPSPNPPSSPFNVATTTPGASPLPSRASPPPPPTTTVVPPAVAPAPIPPTPPFTPQTMISYPAAMAMRGVPSMPYFSSPLRSSGAATLGPSFQSFSLRESVQPIAAPAVMDRLLPSLPNVPPVAPTTKKKSPPKKPSAPRKKRQTAAKPTFDVLPLQQPQLPVAQGATTEASSSLSSSAETGIGVSQLESIFCGVLAKWEAEKRRTKSLSHNNNNNGGLRASNPGAVIDYKSDLVISQKQNLQFHQQYVQSILDGQLAQTRVVQCEAENEGLRRQVEELRERIANSTQKSKEDEERHRQALLLQEQARYANESALRTDLNHMRAVVQDLGGLLRVSHRRHRSRSPRLFYDENSDGDDGNATTESFTEQEEAGSCLLPSVPTFCSRSIPQSGGTWKDVQDVGEEEEGRLSCKKRKRDGDNDDAPTREKEEPSGHKPFCLSLGGDGVARVGTAISNNALFDDASASSHADDAEEEEEEGWLAKSAREWEEALRQLQNDDDDDPDEAKGVPTVEEEEEEEDEWTKRNREWEEAWQQVQREEGEEK